MEIEILNANELEAHITHRSDGRYAVALKDVDSGEFLPTVKIFNDISPARAYGNNFIHA